MKSALLIRHDDPKRERIEWETLADLYGPMDCRMIEPLKLRDGRWMLLDEDGLLRKKPLNVEASSVAGRPIVGHVAIIGRRDL